MAPLAILVPAYVPTWCRKDSDTHMDIWLDLPPGCDASTLVVQAYPLLTVVNFNVPSAQQPFTVYLDDAVESVPIVCIEGPVLQLRYYGKHNGNI